MTEVVGLLVLLALSLWTFGRAARLVQLLV